MITKESISWITKIQTETEWSIENIFFAFLTLLISKSLYLFTLGVIKNKLTKNPKKIIADNFWLSKSNSLSVKTKSKEDKIIPKTNSLGKNFLKKFLASLADRTVKTIGEIRIMKEIIEPNKVAARKFVI